MTSHTPPLGLAILGYPPAFPPEKPVPQIYPSGFGHPGEHSSVDAIMANESSPGSVRLANRQRFVSKALAGAGPSFRSILERRLTDFLDLDPNTSSVICLSKGTNAIRAALKALLADNDPTTRNEIIVPALTVVSTAEAAIMEGYTPVITEVDPHSWMLSPEATAQNISKKTAAIITVDWLGTHVDLAPFRELADKHGLKLISDSAQSFGALPGKPPAIDLADALIFSTGSPKVFHTGGKGGILICSKSHADWLKTESTGILRHEVMPEVNAAQGLRALDDLPKALEVRLKAGDTYCQLLSEIPGIAFQKIPAGLGTNYYQLSVTVDRKRFGLDAKTLCEALLAENILCSAGRVTTLASTRRIQESCRIVGDLRVSQELSENSATLPIFNHMTLELCGTICSYIKLIHEQSATIESHRNLGTTIPLPPSEPADVVDLASKFRSCLVVRTMDEAEFISRTSGVSSTILVPSKYLIERRISIDELHRAWSSKQQWNLGDEVIDELIVDSKNGTTAFLSPRSGDSQIAKKSVSLDESGSSADVALVIGDNGELEVHKKASGYGIDGNGVPWLRRQMRFLAKSDAVRKTNLFVKPLWLKDGEESTSIAFPYIASHTLAEMAFAGMPPASLLTVLSDLLGEMSTNVWCEGHCDASPSFIEQAHFSRIERRIEIARAAVPQLDELANYESITLNGRKLLGFLPILKALRSNSLISAVNPTKLSEIHGDLNIHNILCQLQPDAAKPVVLIDPRGVPLLDESASTKGFEAGDYCYDLSKLKFSLSGFAEIRKGMFRLQGEGQSYELTINSHPGTDTMVGADRDLFTALSSNEAFMKWVHAVEPSGFESMELRTLLGEAAHFVADSACALGRDKKEEVLPLFLLGLEKLNDILLRVQGEGDRSIDKPKAVIESPNYGVSAIQTALLKLGSSDVRWSWDVLEVLVKSESTSAARELLSELVGEYLPEGTKVHVSTDPVRSASFPCVLIHQFDGTRGQTHAVLSAVRRTSTFFRDAGVSQETIDGLRTVTVGSTGASTRSQYTARQNDKLLTPGSWGISPLKLIVMQANQVVFPRPGRWIVENDSFFLLSRALTMGGDGMCLLASKRPTTGSNSSWRVCIGSTEEVDGRTFATGFRDIGPNEQGEKLLRATSAIFVPNHLGQLLSQREADYATRTSPLLIDFVLSRFMSKSDWVGLCHSQGFGINSHLAWNNAQQLAAQSPKVELAYGGDELKFYHFGTDSEYVKMIDRVSSDPLLNSLAYLPAMAKWCLRRVGPESGKCSQTDIRVV